MTPIPLAAPDGTVYAYACGVCHHVPAAGELLGRGEPGWQAEASLSRAERCCTCQTCGEPTTAGESRFKCRACETKFWASLPPPDPDDCQGIECRIGRGRCSVCGASND